MRMPSDDPVWTDPQDDIGGVVGQQLQVTTGTLQFLGQADLLGHVDDLRHEVQEAPSIVADPAD